MSAVPGRAVKPIALRFILGEKCVGCHLCTLVCPTEAMGVSKRVPKKN